MRAVEGVIAKRGSADELKKHSLFLDKLHVIEGIPFGKATPYSEASYDFLVDTGFVNLVEGIFKHSSKTRRGPDLHFFEGGEIDLLADGVPKRVRLELRVEADDKSFRDDKYTNRSVRRDALIRQLSSVLSIRQQDSDIIPVFELGMPDETETESTKNLILKIALEQFPTPGPGSAWEDILDFKREMHQKHWDFRRFLHTLSTKKQTEAEIRDDIEWTVNEYRKAMNIHHIKAGNSFTDVYVIPVIELAEDLVKFNWTKIARGALSVKKRQVELMEAEMKAPGRECAYVFEAQNRFGGRA